MMRLFKKIFRSPYHFLLALFGALWYRFPSRKIPVIAVTGTKGKTSVTEMINSIFEAAGYTTALSNTIRFKIGDTNNPNVKKMTMPGRFFLQHFLNRAAIEGANVAIIEMTSEGARQFRHRFISLDALVVTNIEPEHIESHGSFENYIQAKLSIGWALARSSKKKKVLVVNNQGGEVRRFTKLPIQDIRTYDVTRLTSASENAQGITLTFCDTEIKSVLRGKPMIENILASATLARAFNIPEHIIAKGIQKLEHIPGRFELVQEGQPFTVVIDYAHTRESLISVYETFKTSRKICVLGATGGGRDKWKREVFGNVADTYCDHIILTNEDPYDEDPEKIIHDIAGGITSQKPQIIIDRKEAIRTGIHYASSAHDAVIITGKGTDPYIMGPQGSKEPWSDYGIAQDVLRSVLTSKNR